MFDIIRKYNFWDNQKIEIGYTRKEYLPKMINSLDNSLVKVILGQRRTGKSYIMRGLIHQLINTRKVPLKNILYINKDMQELDFINNSNSLLEAIKIYQAKLKPKGKIFIILDEIQEIQDWEKTVNSLSQDYTCKYEIFISGSNSNLLSRELSSYLTGRYIDIEIFPFSYDEYLDYYSYEKQKDTYLDYLKTGGMPELYHLQDHEIKRNYIFALKDSIVLRDIVLRYNIRDLELLNILIDFLIDSSGKLFSINNIVTALRHNGYQTNIETVGNYLHYLIDSYFIHESPRYDLKGKRILSKERKYYLNDLSFKYYLTSSFDKEISRFLENIVFMHFKRLGYTIYTGKLNNKEIDFIVEKDKELKYIQVSYLLSNESIVDREFGNLSLIKDNYEKIVVSLDDINIGNINGIKHVNAWLL